MGIFLSKTNLPSIFIVLFIIFISSIVIMTIATIQNKKKIKKLADGAIEMTPKEFLTLRKQNSGRKGYGQIKKQDFPGVYIIYNKTKNMYYVGQSVNTFERVNKHFTGKGNGDVYADYKYGDDFTLKLIRLEGSGFPSLNALEKQTIATYNAFSKGYNKTRGNKG